MSTNDETTTHRTRTNQRAARHDDDIARANDVEAVTTSDARADGGSISINTLTPNPLAQHQPNCICGTCTMRRTTNVHGGDL